MAEPIGTPGAAPETQALARFQLRTARTPSLWTGLLETARRSVWWLLADFALMALAWQMGATSTVFVGAAAALAPFVVTAWGWRRVGYHRQMLRAWAVGDWPAVRQLAAQLQKGGPPSVLLQFDLDVRLASIDAREGKLAEGLRRIAPWPAKLADKPGLFESRAATVYSAGGDMQSFVQTMGQAYEQSKHDPSRGVDYALALARFGDVDQASALIESIDATLLPPNACSFVDWVRGLVQARRGQPEALNTLGAAVSGFLQRADQPAVWTSLAFAAADHALALKCAGYAAQAQIANVWPVLKPHADAALLQTLQAEGLMPAASNDSKA